MKLVSIFISALVSINAFAHGEDTPEPHNGYIKMLGTFHVEAAADTDGSFHVFLLEKSPFKCDVMGNNHYHCKTQGKYDLKRGKLLVKQNAKARLVKAPTPSH